MEFDPAQSPALALNITVSHKTSVERFNSHLACLRFKHISFKTRNEIDDGEMIITIMNAAL